MNLYEYLRMQHDAVQAKIDQTEMGTREYQVLRYRRRWLQAAIRLARGNRDPQRVHDALADTWRWMHVAPPNESRTGEENRRLSLTVLEGVMHTLETYVHRVAPIS